MFQVSSININHQSIIRTSDSQTHQSLFSLEHHQSQKHMLQRTEPKPLRKPASSTSSLNKAKGTVNAAAKATKDQKATNDTDKVGLGLKKQNQKQSKKWSGARCGLFSLFFQWPLAKHKCMQSAMCYAGSRPQSVHNVHDMIRQKNSCCRHHAALVACLSIESVC